MTCDIDIHYQLVIPVNAFQLYNMKKQLYSIQEYKTSVD